ncbi:hypothetical protein CCAX7_59710 [Capsulimonas corticalis]|uniref:Uncharacterized protein n=1 Tax=Capsulimonas corticalis TaxID=2219043 RepID=A0A402CZR5_9BACT|nr:DUF2750 domain-containing protein [Capsulimonas corticalis]BDI33920.1 hypothetical protein CCAX7_59710 [Capsulimonas corticalis]
MHDKEFETVSALPFQERYAHFIKRVADHEHLWSLWNDGWVLAADNDRHEVVPVWPHERYAAACAIDEWAGHTPRAIDLDEWLEKWIPGLERDGRLVVVFLTPSSAGATVTPENMRQELEDELLWYE